MYIDSAFNVSIRKHLLQYAQMNTFTLDVSIPLMSPIGPVSPMCDKGKTDEHRSLSYEIVSFCLDKYDGIECQCLWFFFVSVKFRPLRETVSQCHHCRELCKEKLGQEDEGKISIKWRHLNCLVFFSNRTKFVFLS